MTTAGSPPVADQQLVDAFLHYLSTGEDPDSRISPGLEGEMNFPGVSFTLPDKAACDRARDQVSDHPWVFTAEPAVATSEGFAVVADYLAGHGGRDLTFRTVTLVAVTDGVVTSFKHWCTGALHG